MTREVRWEYMFPDQLEAAFAECPVIYFTYGMCEPHGPYNALGLDMLKAYRIGCEAARTHGGIVAPPDCWHVHDRGGYSVWAHQHVGECARKWATSLPPAHHFKSICYHLRVADTLGAKAAIFLTGHYGPNWKDLKTLLALAQEFTGTRLYGLPDFEANYRGFDLDGASGGDHAGKVETSLLMALEPGCVDLTRMPEQYQQGKYFAMGRDAHQANRQVGERMVRDEVEYLGRKAAELLAEYDRLKPAHRLRTYRDVENFWRDKVEPELPDFACMKECFCDPPATVPPGSVWFENWR